MKNWMKQWLDMLEMQCPHTLSATLLLPSASYCFPSVDNGQYFFCQLVDAFHDHETAKTQKVAI